jgi:hypothetical protein
MKSVKSLRMEGDVTTDGQKVSLHMQLTTDGDCRGTIGLMGGSAELVSVGGDTWFKPDEAFWNATAGGQADQIIEVVGDKWVVMPPDQSDVTSLCDLDELLDELDSDGKDEKVDKGETEEVDGEEAVVIEGESDEGDPVKAWVAVDDKHYILKMEVAQGEEPGEIAFSDFDEELDVEAPAEDEVIDFTQMAG